MGETFSSKQKYTNARKNWYNLRVAGCCPKIATTSVFAISRTQSFSRATILLRQFSNFRGRKKGEGAIEGKLRVPMTLTFNAREWFCEISMTHHHECLFSYRHPLSPLFSTWLIRNLRTNWLFPQINSSFLRKTEWILVYTEVPGFWALFAFLSCTNIFGVSLSKQSSYFFSTGKIKMLT